MFAKSLMAWNNTCGEKQRRNGIMKYTLSLYLKIA